MKKTKKTKIVTYPTKLNIKENFLEESVFEDIRNTIVSNTFAWFLQNEQNEFANDGFFFAHKLYDGDHINSASFNSIVPALKNKIKYQSLRRCSINLSTTPNNKSIFHTDYKDNKVTTGILYINENDGCTEFKTGEKIQSVPNTFVEFPSALMHRSISQTDNNYRIVLNINYYK